MCCIVLCCCCVLGLVWFVLVLVCFVVVNEKLLMDGCSDAVLFGQMIDPSNSSRYYSVDTLYSVCEAGLFRQMVDFLEGVEMDVSFVNLFQDVRETTDRIHRNGMLKGAKAQKEQIW